MRVSTSVERFYGFLKSRRHLHWVCKDEDPNPLFSPAVEGGLNLEETLLREVVGFLRCLVIFPFTT
jgi:hypothetical protein